MLDFHKEKTFLGKNKFQGIVPTNILAPLQVHSIFDFDIYMDYIVYIICQLHHFIYRYIY